MNFGISQISTTWRSGSTFLGDVLLAHPATYYHYEPPIHYGIKQVRSSSLDGLLAEDAVRVIKNVLNCDYNELGELIYQNTKMYLKLYHILNK